MSSGLTPTGTFRRLGGTRAPRSSAPGNGAPTRSPSPRRTPLRLAHRSLQSPAKRIISMSSGSTPTATSRLCGGTPATPSQARPAGWRTPTPSPRRTPLRLAHRSLQSPAKRIISMSSGSTPTATSRLCGGTRQPPARPGRLAGEPQRHQPVDARYRNANVTAGSFVPLGVVAAPKCSASLLTSLDATSKHMWLL